MNSRAFLNVFAAGTIVALFAGCKSNNFNVRYWDATKPGFLFPEVDPKDELRYEPILDRPNSGICISGGGAVSAALAAGYFKGLQECKLLEEIRYVSGVSGGTWGSAPFEFLPAGALDSTFYGVIGDPDKMTEDVIEMNPEGSMTHATTHAPVLDLTLANILSGHEAYPRAIGEIFLQPFGIDSPIKNCLKRRKIFTTDRKAMKAIQRRNPRLRDKDFIFLKKDRPFYIMNTTIFVPKTHRDDCDPDQKDCIYTFEMTPLYSGMRAVHGSRNPAGQAIGGSYVESFGFNTTALNKHDGFVSTESRYRFELCQPVGTSGAAFEEKVIDLSKGKILEQFIPQFKYWNPVNPNGTQTVSYDFGDGGLIEDTGVVALLTRKVENIAMFLTEPVFFPGEEKPFAEGFGERFFGYNQIAVLFGAPIIDTKKSTKKSGKVVYMDDPYPRKVFEDDTDNTAFKKLLKDLYQARQSGGPLLVKHTHPVVDNPFFAIKGGWDCTVIWSVIDTYSDWEKLLPNNVSDQIGEKGNELHNFPEVSVFDQNPPHIIQLTPKQSNLLGALAYWIVKKQHKTFKNVLGD